MRIAIFGAGGVGGYFGGRLAEAGEEVTFIARGRHLAALQDDGLTVESPGGDFRIAPARATDDPANVDPVDVVIVGTKAWQVAAAGRAMQPMVGPRTCVLPLQNGVEAADELSRELGADRVLGGMCRISAEIAGPGRIRHLGIDPVIVFGELDNNRTGRVEALKRSFEEARGVRAEIAADIHAAVWEKYLFIVAVSGLGAVTRVPIGAFRAVPETRALLTGVMEEVRDVAKARGIDLGPDPIERTLAFIDALPEEATASMHRDIAAGRPSELDYQNGAVVRLGREAGVATPLNRFIYHALLPSEKRARSRDD